VRDKMQIKDIQPNNAVDILNVEVIDLEEPREFTNFRGTGRVANAKVRDETGEIKLTLWNEQVDQIKVNDRIVIENGWAKEYRGELQVSTGKFGKITIAEE